MTSKLFIFIAGSMSGLFWPNLPSIYTTCSLFIIACLIVTKYPRIFCFLIGVVWMASVGHWQCTLQLSSAEFSKPIWIKGEVLSLSDSKNAQRFNFTISHINQRALLFKRKVRISWQAPSWPLSQGQIVNLLVKLKPIHGLANEGGFNYQQWLFSEGILATGYVKSHDSNELLDNTPTARQRVLDNILDLHLSQEKWILALTIGYRGLLEPHDWALVQKTGIAHLIAISGLHLALVASLSYAIFTWLGGLIVSRFFYLHKVNVHTLAVISCLLTTFLYSSLAGFGLPTLRAWIMLLIFTSVLLLNKNMSSIKVLLLGISCFILLFPLSLFGASFWLSFSAVIIIWLVFWRWPVTSAGFSIKTAIASMLRIQLALSLLMLPIVAWQFSYISFISPMVNLIAVPLVTLILVPLCLLAVICLFFNQTLAAGLFQAINFLIEGSLVPLEYISKHHWTVMDIAQVPLWCWGLCMLALVLFFLPRLLINKLYLSCLFLPLLSYAMSSRSGNWFVDVLDVGQGVSVLISKNDRALIYDVGAKYPSGFNMADSVILPILKAKGMKTLDKVFISHGDNDHAGSLALLQNKIIISELITNQDDCRQGYVSHWQGLTLSVLWPDDAENYNDNNGSCVVKISDNNHSILLTGDIDQSIESHLIKLYGPSLKADVLLAPHHGSLTSSSIEFIKVVNPEYVVFSQGFMNRWGFPKPEVVTRYKKHGVSDTQIYRTSEVGQVKFVFKSNATSVIDVQTYRFDLYPYWYRNMPNCCTNSGLFRQISH